jgi:hypothetical protein
MPERISLPNAVEENATVEDLRFIFSQAKDRISVLTEDAEHLYQRSVVLTTLCITSITGIIGYIGSHLNFNFSTLLLGTIGAFLWISLTVLKQNLIPTDYWGIGSEPVGLSTEAFFTDLQQKSALLHLLYSEIISYQYRIDVNKANNELRASKLREAIKWLYWIPVMSMAILAISIVFGFL